MQPRKTFCFYFSFQLSSFADKSEGGQFGQEIDIATHNLEEYSDTLSVEMEKRVELLSAMLDCRTANDKKLTENKKMLAVNTYMHTYLHTFIPTYLSHTVDTNVCVVRMW